MSRPRSIAILQSNYIPWKGYFDIVAAVDEFIIFDEVQFTRQNWRNRNRVVLDGKMQWLTIPVASKGTLAPIDQMEIADPRWAAKHWQTIQQAYRKAPNFQIVASLLEELYANADKLEKLTEVNELFLRVVAGQLGLTTKFVRSSEIPRRSTSPTGRLVEICLARGAVEYLSGPAARDYIKPEEFDAAGVALRYVNYSGYPVYDQKCEPFEHGVSIIDTLARCGLEARSHLKSLADRASFLSP